MRPEGLPKPTQRLRTTMLRERARRRLLLLFAAGIVLLCAAGSRLRPKRPAPAAAAAAAPAPADGSKPAAAAGVDLHHPLFKRIADDLTLFNLSGITQQMVEQAYCQGTRGSMRVQVRRAGFMSVLGRVCGECEGCLPGFPPCTCARCGYRLLKFWLPLTACCLSASLTEVVNGSVYDAGESPGFTCLSIPLLPVCLPQPAGGERQRVHCRREPQL